MVKECLKLCFLNYRSDFCIALVVFFFFLYIKVRQPPRPSQSLSTTSSCIIIVADLWRSSTDVRFSKILRLFLESTSRTQLCKATHPPQNIETHSHTYITHTNCSSFLTNITELTSYPRTRAYEAECYCNGIFVRGGERQFLLLVSRAMKDKDRRVPVALH